MELKQFSPRTAIANPSILLCVLLVAAWAAMMGVLGVSQIVGGPLGLNIHPTGEDRVWTDLLDRGGFTTHRSWWALASRNPLAPWWYDATTILTSLTPSGLYICKRLVELAIAIFSALLVFEILDRKRLANCFMLGSLVLVWNFSGYIEQILFVMLIALAFTLITLYTYVRYLKSQRTTNEWLLISLASYFVALGTYTIQCGVPLAILILALAYGDRALSPSSKRSAARQAWMDTIYFVVVFGLFSMFWITASGPTSSYFKVSARLIIQNSWTSISNLLWHQDTINLTRTMLQHWSSTFIWSTAVVAFVCWLLMSSWVAKKSGSTSNKDASFPLRLSPAFVFLTIAASIAIPTFALEAMSSIWYPGSRSRMIQQVFQPVLYFGIAFTLFESVRRLRTASPVMLNVAMAGLVAFGFVVSLEYNRQLSELSAYERTLVAGLKQLTPEVVRPTRFIVRLDNDDWYGGRNAELNRILMRQSFQSDMVSLDAIFKGDADPTICLKIGDDNSGVYCPSSRAFHPYSDVVFASYDGREVKRLQEVSESTFAGFQAIYQRDTKVQNDRLVSMRPKDSRIAFQFDALPPGNGWSVPETSGSGETFVWMTSTTANFEFYRIAGVPMLVNFKILQPMSAEIRESLTLKVDGQPIALKVIDKTDEKWTYAGEVPASQMDEISLLKFQVAKTVAPPGSNRELAVPFDWIEIAQQPDTASKTLSASRQAMDFESHHGN